MCHKISKHGTMEEIDQKSLTICSGIDYTNIHYQHVICADAKTAKVVKQNKNKLFFL